MADIAQDAQISPDESAVSGASKLFFFLWDAAWSHAPGTVEADADALHDMRVDLRRLRTAMSNFEGSKKAPLLSKSLRGEIRGARAEIGALGDKLGAVRDYDVLEEYVLKYQKKFVKLEVGAGSGLADLIQALQKERAEAFKPMVKKIQRADKPGEVREELGRWALGLPAAKVEKLSYREAAKRVLAGRLNEVFTHENSLQDGAEPEEQHELRKSLRRVRYTLETMSVCFEKPVKPFIKTLVEMQDTLGEMQDRAVLAEVTTRIFEGELPEDVAAFNQHGVQKHGELLETTRRKWKEAGEKGFWDSLRAL
jgi:CHAD domain-containing protein